MLSQAWLSISASQSKWEKILYDGEYDYIVIGSGCTALAFIEETLKNDPTKHILCLERGGEYQQSKKVKGNTNTQQISGFLHISKIYPFPSRQCLVVHLKHSLGLYRSKLSMMNNCSTAMALVPFLVAGQLFGQLGLLNQKLRI